MKRRYPLDSFVNRILLRRLALVSLVMCLVIGAATWVKTRGHAREYAVSEAIDRVAIMRAHYSILREEGLPLDEAVSEAIASVTEMDFDHSQGRFVFAAFYDRHEDFYVFRDTTFAAHRAAELVVGTDRSRRPGPGQDISSLVKVAGRPAVRVIIPVTRSDRPPTAWLTAVYLLSPAAAAELVRGPLATVGWVIMIVLAVSTLFYPVVLKLARRLAGLSADLLEANLEMIEALGCAIAKRDGDTDAHNYRVTIYSVRLAEKEGLAVNAMQGLIKGAFLHDIGKIGIRDNILLKPDRLTSEEFKIMKTHVDHGMDIVGQAHWLHDALDIVGSHHEKFNGNGYPSRVLGDMIPTAARIFTIADVFDALCSPRPYKEAMPLSRVVEILEEGRGEHFDPDLLTSFLEIAPDLQAELAEFDDNDLRDEMHRINRRYFASGLETLLI